MSYRFFCGICMGTDTYFDNRFTGTNCTHTFCTECVGSYVVSKRKENRTTITCPATNCNDQISPDMCRKIVPKDVLDRWECALAESLIADSQKTYCPFKDCSAGLENDGVEIVTSSECPYCRRLFCAQCKVVWHSGMECSEYQKLNKNERGIEDLMLMELAKKNKWRRCSKCLFYIERNEGCLHITCRCGFQFCYGCGADYSSTHACPAP